MVVKVIVIRREGVRSWEILEQRSKISVWTQTEILGIMQRFCIPGKQT